MTSIRFIAVKATERGTKMEGKGKEGGFAFRLSLIHGVNMFQQLDRVPEEYGCPPGKPMHARY